METTSAWEQDGIKHGELRPIIGAVDETFLQRMMLVFMDLASGYLVMEEVAADRTYDTWSGLVGLFLNSIKSSSTTPHKYQLNHPQSPFYGCGTAEPEC